MDDRASPHNLDAERALLGGLLLDPTQIDQIRQVLPGPESFFGGAHQALYAWMLSQPDVNRIDIVHLADHMIRTASAERFGGVAYATDLPERCPSVENLGYYAGLIVDKAILRSLMTIGGEIRRLSVDGSVDGPALLALAAGKLDVLQDQIGRVQKGWRSLAEVVDAKMERTQRIASGEEQVRVLPSGWPELDLKIGGGLLRGEGIVIIAGRAGMGKTAAMIDVLRRNAEAGNAGACFSLEMADQRLVERMLATESSVSGRSIRMGELNRFDWERLEDAHKHLRRLPVWIDDTPQLSASQIRRRARLLKRQHPELALVCVDYVQIMGTDQRGRSREQEVAQASASLSAMAKEIDVCVVVLAQMNRDVERRADKTPQMSDLRESGALEQDASLILFPFRPAVYDEERDESEAYLVVGKGRNGGAGERIRVRWNGQKTTFEPMDDQDLPPWPAPATTNV